jgi:DNA-binding MarR family transcriptional regulator
MLEVDHAEALLDEIVELYAMVLWIARHANDRDQPMTATQRLAMIEIVAIGPLRLNHLARILDTTPATATRAVDALEDAGLVRRRPDPADARGVIVSATAAGKRWSARRRALVRDTVAEIPAAAAPQRLISDLARLNAALRTTSGQKAASSSALLAR